MSRNALRDPEFGFLLEQLCAAGEHAPPLDDKLHMVQAIRAHSAEAAAHLDRFFVQEVTNLHQGLTAAKESQEKLKAVLEKLGGAPWFPAVFLGLVETERGPAAMVMHGGMRRVVNLTDEVDPATLVVGDEVLLAHELNALMSKSSMQAFQCGETATFERYMPDRRMVLRAREEEIVVDAAGWLRELEFRAGDQVRFDRTAWLAYEKIERSRGDGLFLEDTPRETFADVGGLDAQIEELQEMFLLHLFHADEARLFGLPRKKAVLVWGPPGTGKTLVAKALANWLAQLSKSGRSRFINVKPGGLHSMWYGQTEHNYREVFRVARQAGEQEPEVPVVMFFDEVDSIGGSRGEALQRIDDKVLNAFMAELNGLEDRGNVVVVTATNRLNALDEALVRPGRLGDLVLQIPRPNRKAACDILGKHLQPEVPYAANGHDPAAARQTLIESIASRIYSPNGDADLATLVFRDGKRHAVRARDLVSGAWLAKVALRAKELGARRAIRKGLRAVTLEDGFQAAAEFFEAAVRPLTPANCRRYLDDLPQDVDVVKVERPERKVAQPQRYLKVA
jgi:proteasome-associated ATPase